MEFKGSIDTHLKGELAPIYVVSSDEELLLFETVDKIREAARKNGFTERDVLTVGTYFKWETLQESSCSMSLFGDKKIIELRISKNSQGEVSLRKDGSSALSEYVESASFDNLTIITLPELSWKSKKDSWVQTLKNSPSSVFIEIAKVKREQLGAWVSSRLRAQKQSVDKDSLDFIVNNVEGNLLAAYQEIQKLGLLYGEGELTFDQVKASLFNVARYDVTQLIDAILLGDTPQFVRVLEGIKGEGAAIPQIMGLLVYSMRSLFSLRLDVDGGISIEQAIQKARLPFERRKSYAQALRRLSAQKIEMAMKQLADIDKVSKGLRVETLTENAWEALLQLGLFLTTEKTSRTMK